MRKPNSLLLSVMSLTILCVATVSAWNYVSAAGLHASQPTVQKRNFINVEGANLNARLDAAIRMARSNPAKTPYWTAYSFDVRSGVAVDLDINNFDGTVNNFSGTSISMGKSSGAAVETRNLGIFLLHEPNAEQVTRVEIYNLDRQREYSSYPVYWLGRAGNGESTKLLQTLVSANQGNKIVEHAVTAIALHDDPRVGAILKEFVRNPSSSEKLRTTAVFWLGQTGGETAFLADLVRREDETTEVRRQAAFSIGVGKDKDALTTLQNLYASVGAREVKKQIIFAASINESKDDAIGFLIKVAQTDNDREARKQALFWLGQKAGKRSLEALTDTVTSSNADTEVQKQAVFAISQRSKDEAVPLLINIARTHQNPTVRKQAIFWLGQTGDERALEFFKEILTK